MYDGHCCFGGINTYMNKQALTMYNWYPSVQRQAWLIMYGIGNVELTDQDDKESPCVRLIAQISQEPRPVELTGRKSDSEHIDHMMIIHIDT